jgi:uncharacterized membrane protein
MTALAWIVAIYALVLVAVPGARPPFLRDRVAIVPLAVVAHLCGSAVALALGPFQFDAALRLRAIARHRWTGRAYLAGVLVGGLSALVLARISQGGTAAHLGFATLGILWLTTGLEAYRRIRAGDREGHRRWMIRNYALTFAAANRSTREPLRISRWSRYPRPAVRRQSRRIRLH